MKVSTVQAGRRLALVDSSAYLALLDKDDSNHGTAREVSSALANSRFSLLTTNFVVAESHALILSALGQRMARDFLEEVGRGPHSYSSSSRGGRAVCQGYHLPIRR